MCSESGIMGQLNRIARFVEKTHDGLSMIEKTLGVNPVYRGFYDQIAVPEARTASDKLLNLAYAMKTITCRLDEINNTISGYETKETYENRMNQYARNAESKENRHGGQREQV